MWSSVFLKKKEIYSNRSKEIKASTVSDIRQVGGTVTYTAKRTIYTSNKIINAGDVVSDKNELIGKNPYYARSNQTLTYNDVDNQGKSIRNLFLFNTDECSLDTISTGRWVISGYGWDQEISDKHYFERIIGGGIPALGHQSIDVKAASPWVLVEPWGRVTESNVDQLLKQNINGGKLVSDEETYLLNSENGSVKKIAAGEKIQQESSGSGS